MRCRFCGSTALQNDTQRKNFSTGKAVAGAVTFGVVGAAAGFIGKDIAGYRCGACGQFMAEPMDFFLEMQINEAVRNAESGKDLTMIRYYQEQFPNVKARIPAVATPVQHEPVERPVLAASEKSEKETEPVKRCYEPGIWQPDCPIFVETVTLRTKGSEDQMSLSAVNLSKKTVRSAYFQAVIYDDTGDEVARKKCVYQNLSVSGGDVPVQNKRLPEDKAFPLGTDLAHRVDLICEKVAFADDEVWRAEEPIEILALPEQPILSAETFPRYRYIQSKFRTSDKDVPLRMPLESDGFWMCDCGHPAKNGEPCSFCGDTLPSLQEAFSQKTLEALQLAAVKDRAAKRAKFSKKAYDNALKDKKQSIYQKALALENKKTAADMREAIEFWEQIPDYSDAKQHLKQCRERVPELEEKEAKEKAAREAEEKAARAAKEKATREAEEAAAAAKKKRNKLITLTAAAAMVILVAVLVVTKIVIPSGNYNKAVALMESGDYDAATAAFEAMNGYKDSAEKIAEIENRKAQAAEEAAQEALDQAIQKAEDLEKSGNLVEAAMAYGALADQDPTCWERSSALWKKIVPQQSIATGHDFTIGLKQDGTVVTAGSNSYSYSISDWSEIESVDAGQAFAVGLRSDGTVVTTNEKAVSEWTSIVAVSANKFAVSGLKADGTVVTTLGLQEELDTWTGIVAVSTGDDFVVGLKADGTVVAAGSNESGECDVSDWTDIVAISAGVSHTLGLKSDGTVVSAGSDKTNRRDVSGWTDIVAIAAGHYHSVGLKSDGTVVAVGADTFGITDVSGWNHVVQIAVSSYHTVGLKSDGTAVATGDRDYGACNVSDWTAIRVPDSE